MVWVEMPQIEGDQVVYPVVFSLWQKSHNYIYILFNVFIHCRQIWRFIKCNVLGNLKWPASRTSWHCHNTSIRRTLGTYILEPFHANPSLQLRMVWFAWNHSSVRRNVLISQTIFVIEFSTCTVPTCCCAVLSVCSDAGIMVCIISFLLLAYCGMRDKASARKFFPPGIYFKRKLKHPPNLLGRELSWGQEGFQILMIHPDLEL